MHIQSSDAPPISPSISVEPRDGDRDAAIHLRPLGVSRTGSRYLWPFTADEAEQIGQLLLDAARQARSFTR
jgi:hypothetical protein